VSAEERHRIAAAWLTAWERVTTLARGDDRGLAEITRLGVARAATR